MAKRSNGRSSVQRGKTYEREVAAHCSTQLGIHVGRVCSTTKLEDNYQGDYDLFGLRNLAPECKRTERLDLAKAWSQAVKNAGPNVPCVISRRNRIKTGDSFVHLRLDDFLTFYRAWLVQQGHLKPSDPCPTPATPSASANTSTSATPETAEP